ncbi:hypothetical protein QBC35DRAFT_547091 [Podospora australis]|uniref:BZIP domain-containing protein n=1 Tax=Podospora australis TaxID=1536484 RepID=A0AAN6X467_9PEZI|nr:hypothetical protein QBC35DRAFT_547091 [Podospora australis]
MSPNSTYRSGVIKFSTKPAGHDAARQRENQRRHRARVKGRIEDLEAALSKTQSELNDALRYIEKLAVEACRLKGVVNTSDLTTACSVARDEEPQVEVPTATATHLDEDGTKSDTPVPLQYTRPLATEKQTPEGECNDEPTVEDETADCPSLPPPRPGESTILCREAYSIIKDRSSPEGEVDSELVDEWLKPGFRRAIVPGSGCRVETHVLFAFIDHITST